MIRVSKKSGKSAFTLIEIMVVLVIIVILSSIVLPVVFRALGRAKTRQAQAETHSLVLAIRSYHNVFGKWPGQTSADDVYYFTNNHIVVTQLMGMNARNQSFINIQTQSLDRNTNYIDPEGVPYVITIAQSGDRRHQTSFTNLSYSNNHTGITNNYSLNLTNTTRVGAGAFLRETKSLLVNSWSDF